MRVLISGFTPQWGIKRTPSGELAKLWNNEKMPVDAEIRALVLPQIFGESGNILCSNILEFRPNIVLMFGASMKSEPIRLEKFAINAEHTLMGDNTKIPVDDRPVIRGGPSAYESTLPIDYLIDHLQKRGIHAKRSYHAGVHTCNALLFYCMHCLASHPEFKTIAGFVHVPFPNEFGVVGDEPWSQAGWPHIVQASVILVQETVNWYQQKFGSP